MNTERETRMALLLKALEDMDIEKAMYTAEWKDRRAKLESDLRTIRYEIITGQSTLFSEGGNGNGQAKTPAANGAGVDSQHESKLGISEPVSAERTPPTVLP